MVVENPVVPLHPEGPHDRRSQFEPYPLVMVEFAGDWYGKNALAPCEWTLRTRWISPYNQGVEDVRGPIPCRVSVETFPESMEDRLFCSPWAHRAPGVDCVVNLTSPVIDCNGFVPYKPKEACLLASSLLRPHCTPFKGKVLG